MRAALEGMHLRKEWQSLGEIVGAAVSQLEDRLHGRPIAVDVPAELPMLYVDRRLIGQALINVLENADRYTPPDRPIQIHARADLPFLLIEVEDGGPGFVVEDPGMGLAICAEIIQAHGGEIEAGSGPEGGAGVRIKLPLTAQPELRSGRELIHDV